MTTTVARLYRFRARHSLPEFPEPWCFEHEHDYTVEVVAVGETDTDRLDRAWNRFGPDDGADLNEAFSPSTVEHIAEVMLSVMPDEVLAVTVWEDRARWGRAER